MKLVPSLSTAQSTPEILRLLMEIYIKRATDKTRWPFDDDCLLGPSVAGDLYTVVANRISYKLVRLQKLCNWLRRTHQDKLAGAVHAILEAEIIRRHPQAVESAPKHHHVLVYEVCVLDGHPAVICLAVQEVQCVKP